jgi:hypothetical protein
VKITHFRWDHLNPKSWTFEHTEVNLPTFLEPTSTLNLKPLSTWEWSYAHLLDLIPPFTLGLHSPPPLGTMSRYSPLTRLGLCKTNFKNQPKATFVNEFWKKLSLDQRYMCSWLTWSGLKTLILTQILVSNYTKD